MQKQRSRILIADDHVLIRHGIKNIINKDSEYQVVGEVADGRELVEFLDKNEVDLIILDISMPGIGGLEAIRLVKNKTPEIKILMLTMHKAKQYFYNALSAGADGYLMKDDSDDELLIAIDKIAAGRTYVSPYMTEDFADDVVNMYRTDKTSPLKELTRREKEVLKLLVKGYTSKKMAKCLNLSQRTIDHHRSNLLRKFNRKNAVDLVHYAVRNGLVEPDEPKESE